MQVDMQQYSMSERWWKVKQSAVVDYNKGIGNLQAANHAMNNKSPKNKRNKRLSRLSKMSSGSSDLLSLESPTEEVAVHRRGLMYFLCPAKRVQITARANKLRAMEQALDEKIEKMLEKEAAEATMEV